MLLTKIGLLINILLAASFGAFLFLTPLQSHLAASVRYTELHRAGVINEDALRAYDSELASNSRYLVPRWLIETGVEGQRRIAWAGIASAVANAFGMVFLGMVFNRLKKPGQVQRREPGTPNHIGRNLENTEI